MSSRKKTKNKKAGAGKARSRAAGKSAGTGNGASGDLKARLADVRARAGRLGYWASVSAVWALILSVVFAIFLAHDLPDITNPPPPASAGRIEVRAVDGSLVATYGAVFGDWLDYRDIPAPLVSAVVATEDRRFFSHYGIDARSIGRALFANLSAGEVRQGASTITQQLAKNLYLSPARTFRRKAQELFLAAWLEARLSKEAILTVYLNRIYFGSGAYGIDAAARTFFGHSARRLTLGEAAMLAGMIKAPSYYAPGANADRALGRMGEVLAIMTREGLIGQAEADAARDGPPSVIAGEGLWNGRYFGDWAVEEVRALLPEGHDGEVLSVYTSLDPHAQKMAEKALGDALNGAGEAANVSQGAVVAMSTDGAIKAMAGGRSYADSQFNRITQAWRQPGSAFKTFVFLAGIEDGMTSDEIFVDEPVSVDGWAPKNYSGQFLGPITVAEAFARSINTVAVKISERVGRGKVAALARRLGITSPIRAHPSLALGTSEVTPLELTAAYGAIASGGFRVQPYAITEIRSETGELLYRRGHDLPERVIEEAAAAEIAHLMQGVVEEGTGRGARLGRPAAGKSGTSQNFRDAWFIGFTSDLIAGVWVGNDDGTAMKGVAGGGLPARIWRNFMSSVHEGLPPTPLQFEAARFEGEDEDQPKKKRGFLSRLFGKKD